MESNINNNSNNNMSNSLEQRFRIEIMRKDAHTPTRKGRRPRVAASKSFDESVMPSRNGGGGVTTMTTASACLSGLTSPSRAASAAAIMSGNASTSGCSVTSGGGGGSISSSVRGGTRGPGGSTGSGGLTPRRLGLLPDLIDVSSGAQLPLRSPSANSMSSATCRSGVSRASSLPKEELKHMRLLSAPPPMSRRGSTGNCGGYAPLDMYGSGSNHSSNHSAASDSTNASSSTCSTAAGADDNDNTNNANNEHDEPSFIRAIRRGSTSKEESQRKLQEQLTMVQDYDEQSDCESISRQALKDRFAPTKKNIKNKRRTVSRRSSIASTGDFSLTSAATNNNNNNLNTVTDHSKNSIGAMSNISLDVFEMSPGGPGTGTGGGGGGHNRNNSNDSSQGRKMQHILSRSVSLYSPVQQQSKLPVANVLERALSSPLNHYHHTANKTDQIIESLVWFSFHVPRTVLEDLISYEIQIWRSQAATSTLPSSAMNNKSSSHHSSNKRKQQRRQERRQRVQRALLRNNKKTKNVSESDDDYGNGNNDRHGYDASDDDVDDDSGGSVSSLSEDEGAGGGDGGGVGPGGDGAAGGGGGGPGGNENNFDANFTESMMRFQGESNAKFMVNLPRAVKRECALLFVDMSGFTKLSTMLDVESLSKVINSYFDMIVSEVIHHGGDILKFAGDAFFAEWKVPHEQDIDSSTHGGRGHGNGNHRYGALADLNASLVSISDMDWDYNNDIPKLSSCVLAAAKCAVSIVEKFSDYHVTSASGSTNDAMLNVHCGLGVGHVVGLHVGDYKEDQEEEGVELRREFLILGDAIEQVSRAADLATDGQVMASAEAMMALSVCCDMMYTKNTAKRPVCIASRQNNFLNLDPYRMNGNGSGDEMATSALQPYESLRMHCKSLNHAALARLHLQMALYVHPVIRSDELALSAAIQAGRISKPTETVETRHRAEAELRSVFTIFIKAIMSPKITGVPEVDEELYKKLADVMHVTSRELDRYSGHLRQFIVDDKGVVLIATFGLRGSTFPNMVSNNGLPAVFAIHRALKTELHVENRIGATFGKVYCGVVGGVRRHEFAVMGAPVNLAARLMGSKVNNGILVDEAVRAQSDARFIFKSLPPVQAKGYDKPVPILEPENASGTTKKKRSMFPFTGRKEEKKAVMSAVNVMLQDPISPSTMIFLMGESGMGKTALAVSILEDIKKHDWEADKTIVTARSTSTETEQRIPLSSYRKIFLSIIRDLCEHDGTLENDMSFCSLAENVKNGEMDIGTSIQAFHQTRRRRSTGMAETGEAGIRPGMNRSMALSPREWKLLGDPKLDASSNHTYATLSQSLRGICSDLQDLSAHDGSIDQSRDQSTRPSLAKLPKSLSTSVHGDFSKTARRKSSELGNSLHHLTLGRSTKAPASAIKAHSIRGSRHPHRLSKHSACQDDQSAVSEDSNKSRKSQSTPYFEKLCWVCEQLDYPFEYADIVGSQFLGLTEASPVTHIDGHVPTMDELVEFLALAFICCADFADLTVLFVDDFQWVDSFSWKIFRVLCKRGKKLLILCAMRSHDKQALRRLSTAATRESELQNQMIEISMVPLDFANIRSLIGLVLEYDKKCIPESICTDIFQRTGGLPVYVVQMLENIKRKGTVEVGEDGMLRWNAAGIKEKRAAANSKTGAVMEETFLSRFDGLDVRVRKVLQTCAVLGLSFAMSDVIQVHPELEELDIENAIDSAVDEMILVEQVEDNDDDNDDLSTRSGSTRESDDHDERKASIVSTDGMKALDDRFFQFSHAMWRKNVLATMLKERKIELHRCIAESMEKSKVLILEESDISRLLTLFDHWKSCGDFCKSAPLALTVGSRLEEWDLSAQSLELYEDALEMAFDCVNKTEEINSEWVQVSAKPAVLDLILRLHVRVGMCHQRLGDEYESIVTFEDAYKIMKTASKIPGASKTLMMPIISSLCVLRMAQQNQSPKAKIRQEKLLAKFVQEALAHRSAVHIGRSLSMQAMFYAKSGNLERGVEIIDELRKVYNVEANSNEMVAEYGRDFVIECLAESIQWYYLLELHQKAERKADTIIEKLLPLVDPMDTDACMNVVLPVIQVLRLVGRSKDADWLLKRYIINPAHDHAAHSQFWVPFFNPLAYVIEIMMMEESETYNPQVLKEMENWVLNEDNSEYDVDLERKAHALMGEMCWRLANFRDDDDPVRAQLVSKAKTLLMPVARFPHDEIFLKHTAQALMEAF